MQSWGQPHLKALPRSSALPYFVTPSSSSVCSFLSQIILPPSSMKTLPEECKAPVPLSVRSAWSVHMGRDDSYLSPALCVCVCSVFPCRQASPSITPLQTWVFLVLSLSPAHTAPDMLELSQSTANPTRAGLWQALEAFCWAWLDWELDLWDHIGALCRLSECTGVGHGARSFPGAWKTFLPLVWCLPQAEPRAVLVVQPERR